MGMDVECSEGMSKGTIEKTLVDKGASGGFSPVPAKKKSQVRGFPNGSGQILVKNAFEALVSD